MPPICHGPCQQGRLRCPCPDACELSEPDRMTGWAYAATVLALLAASVAVLASPFFFL